MHPTNIRYATVPGVVVLLAALGLSTGCSHKPNLTDAEKCSNVHLPPETKVVYLSINSGWQDSDTEFVVDVPTGSLDEIRNASNLPNFAPGFPSSWREWPWHDPRFDADLSRPRTRYIAAPHDSAVGNTIDRKIIAVDIDHDTTRLYISSPC